MPRRQAYSYPLFLAVALPAGGTPDTLAVRQRALLVTGFEADSSGSGVTCMTAGQRDLFLIRHGMGPYITGDRCNSSKFEHFGTFSLSLEILNIHVLFVRVLQLPQGLEHPRFDLSA